ncbi:hypothetical protein [Marinovum sp.]|uniref:hypothetical protein n=1 Tax=Marinovum sp. TaxID=2024839 RepID=UPI003A945514
MIRALVILALTLVAAAVQAATVTVKSGEHGSFTRLVAFLPDGAQWRMTSEGRSATLTLGGTATHKFDTSTVFDRIARNRIASLSQPGGNSLVVALNCACEAKAIFEPPRLLIIDVAETKDAPAVVKEGLEAPALDAAPPALEASLRAPLVTRHTYSTSSVSRFAEALADRTTRQILDVGDPDSPRPERQVALGTEFRNIDLPNIAFSGDAPEGSSGAMAQKRLASCSGVVEAPLGRFAEEIDYFAEKAQLSASLFTEQLTLDPAVAVELAQLHLSQGLGAEARQMLAMILRPNDGRAFLAQLARLIEDPDSLPRSTFEPYRDCSEISAIWPVLAAPRQPMAEEDAWQIARAAESLPRPLLRLVGPRVVANLISSGRKDPANMIARILDRSGTGKTPTMADVLLADAPSDQTRILGEIAKSTGEEAAEASAMLVERQIEAGETVSDDLADLVASHAEEQRHSDTGGLLRKAEAYSLISKQNFEAALAILAAETLEPKAQAAVTEQFFRALAESADTVTFLRIALARPDLAATASAEVRQSLAARLYENRFPEPAARLLDRTEPLSGALLAEALGARYYGDVGIPDEVLFETPQDDTTEAAEARYAALLDAGRFAEAKQVALRLNKPDPVDPLLELASKPVDADAAPELTLKNASALTDATAELAELVGTVLADPALRLDP